MDTLTQLLMNRMLNRHEAVVAGTWVRITDSFARGEDSKKMSAIM